MPLRLALIAIRDALQQGRGMRPFGGHHACLLLVFISQRALLIAASEYSARGYSPEVVFSADESGSNALCAGCEQLFQ